MKKATNNKQRDRYLVQFGAHPQSLITFSPRVYKISREILVVVRIFEHKINLDLREGRSGLWAKLKAIKYRL